MHNIKQILYFLCFDAIHGLVYDNLKQGPCSYKSGDIALDPMDVNELNGFWINVFDRKELNNLYKCYSVELDPLHSEDDEHEMEKLRKSKIFDVS